MRGEYGYFEGDQLGRPADWSLWVRLLQLTKGHHLAIAAATALILLLTMIELALPYLLKIGIDRYIVATYREVRLPEHPSPRLLAALRPLMASTTVSRAGSRLFIDAAELRRLDPALIRQLEQQGILIPRSFYATQVVSPAQQQVVASQPHLFFAAGDRVLVAREDLDKLTAAEVLTLRRRDLQSLWRLTAVFVAFLLVGAAASYGHTLLMVHTGQKMMHALRLRLFNHLQRLSLDFFSRNPVGRLVTRLTNDVQNLDELFSTVLTTLAKDGLLVVGILLVLFKLHWRLTLVSLSVLPLILLLLRVFGTRVRHAYRDIRSKLANINATLNEYISGIRVIQIFQQEERTLERFRRLNHDYYLANLRQITVQAVFFPCIELLSTATIALLLWYGGIQVLEDQLTIGTLVAFVSYLRMFFGPIRDASQKYSIIQSALASAERLFQLLDTNDKEKSPPAPTILPQVRGELEFARVTFAYSPGEPVLTDVSFKVHPGETVAIVGMTGAGKTTLIHLLERFYSPQAGKILLDGTDISALDLRWLRRQLGLIMQDVFLFAGSLRDNICLDRKLPPEQVQQLVEAACLEGIVARLPAGMDSPVHEGGLTLSMGERQLLAIARAMAYDPRILLLDEATANIDSETEHLVQVAMERLFKGRTTLVIAHRLSTVQKADRILVLHRGRLVEQGTQQELLSQCGLYYRLHKLQFASSLPGCE